MVGSENRIHLKGTTARIRRITLLACLALSACLPAINQADTAPISKATATSTEKPKPLLATPSATPTPTPTKTPICETTGGEIIEGSYSSVVDREEFTYLAYLPPCYAVEQADYPVIYLLHGYPYDQTHWLDLELVKTYEQERKSKKWPKVIFVLPSVPERIYTRTDGGVGSYEQELLEGLIPAIEAEFRVLADNDQRVIGGISRGGVWALEIGLRNSDYFEHIVAVSPSLVNNWPRPSYDPFEIVREDRIFPKSIYLSAGENEAPFRVKIEAFVALLDQEGIPYFFLRHPGNHSDASWQAVMEEIVSQLFMGLTS